MPSKNQKLNWAALAAIVAVAGSVAAQPVINVQPHGFTNASIGIVVSLSVSASPSVGLLTVQWRHNGVNIPGATNTSLGVFTAPANCGLFDALVTDGSGGIASATVGITVALPVLTAADSMDQPLALTSSLSGAVRSDNRNATLDSGESRILPDDPGGRSIWFSWTPPAPGIVTFTTAGSGFDTILGIYQGSDRSFPLAIDDDNGGYLASSVTFDARGDSTYAIVVDGYFGAGGDVVLSWNEQVTTNIVTTLFTQPPLANIGAPAASIFLSAGWDNGACTWFLNGAPTTYSDPTVNVPHVDDTSVGAYVAHVTLSGGTVETQPAIVENNELEDGSTTNTSFVWPKFKYAVQSPFAPTPHGGSGGGPGKNSGDTRGYSVSQVFSTVGLASEPGEPVLCGHPTGSPGWYSYVTPAAGTLEVNTAGSSFNTVIGVYTGPGGSFATLTSVGCAYTTDRTLDGQPIVTVPGASVGETFFIAVDGQNGQSGTAHLNVNFGTPMSISVPPVSTNTYAGSNVTFSASATGSTPISYFWKKNGAFIASATTASLTLTNVKASDAGSYTVVASNLVSTASASAVLGVFGAPAITNDLVSHTVAKGSIGTLSVGASGLPAPVFLWRFNTAKLTNSGNPLRLTNFQGSNEGSYFALASNSIGVATSKTAILLLSAPLRFGLNAFTNTGFQLELIGAAGSNYVIAASTDLVSWAPLLTNNASNGFVNLIDTNASRSGRRFYRGLTN